MKCVCYEPMTVGCTKKREGTMYSKFQLGNLTKISDFSERTNNYFKKKNDIAKITETKPIK